MLLRSSSTPILNSWIPHSKEPPPEPETVRQIPKTRPITLTASSTSFSPSPNNDPMKKMTRALSESDLRNLSVPKRNPVANVLSSITVDEDKELGFENSVAYGLLLGNGLEEGCETGLAVLVGGGVGGGGGKICGGGGRDGGDEGRWGSWDSNHGNESTDIYYQRMIEANPGNVLLLSNYARFLKEVRADFVKAEEYCGRALLENPNDGSVLSMYADLIWKSHKDASRAETYFDQAVKVAPDDCYVLASYARFLWDADVEDEDEDEGEREGRIQTSAPSYFHGVPPPPPPLAAAS